MISYWAYWCNVLLPFFLLKSRKTSWLYWVRKGKIMFKFPRSFRPRNSEDSRNSSAACTLHRVGTKSLPIGTAGVGAHGPSCCDELGRKDVSRFQTKLLPKSGLKNFWIWLLEYFVSITCFNLVCRIGTRTLVHREFGPFSCWQAKILKTLGRSWFGVPSMKGRVQGVLGTTSVVGAEVAKISLHGFYTDYSRSFKKVVRLLEQSLYIGF